jgi:hypothetical protein
MGTETISPWGVDWAWGLPMIVFTVMFHVIGLGFIKKRAERRIQYLRKHQTVAVGFLTLALTLLHAFEALGWAALFLLLGALPDRGSAVLYSMNALTAFGHTDIKLARKWQLMGSMESLNGWILFGLSTAYLFVFIEQIWLREISSASMERSPRHANAVTV